MSVEKNITRGSREGARQLAVLLDPDKCGNEDELLDSLNRINRSAADYLLVGGSVLTEDLFHSSMRIIRQVAQIPIIIFPGNSNQVSHEADAILFMSLISGRNPEFLISNQIAAAPAVQHAGLEVMPVGYLLVDGGKVTTAQYISNTTPIPADKPELAATTALAGKMLGLRFIYLDTGSGALNNVPVDMVRSVKRVTNLPLIVGGGIRSGKVANKLWDAGANIIVVGTAFEKNPTFLEELSAAKVS